MNLQYVPLLQTQRDLYSIPRGMERFQQYLRTMLTEDRSGVELAPLVLMNPMGKDHVPALLDRFLAMNADPIAAEVAAEAAARLPHVPGEFKAGLVLVDDAMGGWTNRYATEFELRFGNRRRPWITGVLWTSEEAAERRVRDAMRSGVFRAAYQLQHGPAVTLNDRLAQEGYAMAEAGCERPRLDDDEIEYTRGVVEPHRTSTDHSIAMACLFGDEAAAGLGYSPLGLSPWAGLALALHDAKSSYNAIF